MECFSISWFTFQRALAGGHVLGLCTLYPPVFDVGDAKVQVLAFIFSPAINFPTNLQAGFYGLI